jgi:hypothetical protein
VSPSDRLNAARLAAREGRHAEALREHEWFHRNALKHRPSLYGVRLSFALSDWVELGKVYPKARRSLDRIRREKIAALRKGKGSWHTFHDVASINRYTDRQRDTYRLFARLHSSRPRLAARCAKVAMPAVVNCGDFKLARRYLEDPDGTLARKARHFTDGMEYARKQPRRRKAAVREAHIHTYCKDVELLIAILRGSGERRRAAVLRKAALALIGPSAVRKAVASRLRR